ncbi:MAG: hypothetical protein Q9219_003038 [cf. Caloplaca sp. 3 TL-2023]
MSSPPPDFMPPSGAKEPTRTDGYLYYYPPHMLKSPPEIQKSPQTLTQEYGQHYQSTLDHQRQAFDSERDMWKTERVGLLTRIAFLEESLRQLRRDTNVQPSYGLPIPAENMPPVRNLSESINRMAPFNRAATMSPDPQRMYDGITFKSSPVNPTHPGKTSSKTSATQTYPGSLSKSWRESSGILRLPLAEEEPNNLTKDAGHTPLARTVPGLDGAISALDSDLPTPSHHEQDRQTYEPRASITKIPSERSDSYFPPPEDDFDEDPELRGQLGLKNDEDNDQRFLSELNTKLAQAAASPTSPAVCGSATDSNSLNVDNDEASESEPELKIKKSLNFGSQLGGKFVPRY